MKTDLEEIKNRLNIVDIIGEYLRLEKAGGNWRGLCPFHNEKTPSFMVSEEKQIWHCFGCQKGGDVFSFVMEMEGLEFREALRILAEKAGVELVKENPAVTERKSRTIDILELATKFYAFQLWEGPGKDRILSYLHDRGLSDEKIKEFRLGYAPKGWRNIFDFLMKRGYRLDEIVDSGLAIRKDGSQGAYDRFRGRIMFPIADYSGRVVGYSARVAPGEDESQAKYINSPETGVYHKSRILYGIDKAKGEIKRRDFVLLVEGNMDAIAASQAGFPNVVAVSGTALTSEQVDILKRYTRNFRMFFDMDSAGEAATRKSIRLCLSKDVAVKVVEIPSGKDAADIAKSDPKALRRAVEESKDAVECLFERSFRKHDGGTAQGKRLIADDLLEIIEGFDNPIERSHWTKKLSEGLEIDERALTEMLRKANLKSRNPLPEPSIKDASELERDKMEILIGEAIGLMAVSKEAWEKGTASEDLRLASKRDHLLALMLSQGAEARFDTEDFKGRIGREDSLRLEKLYFEKRFQQGLNGAIEETVIADPSRELDFVSKEIGRELRREKVEDIVRDLRLAEKRGDHAASMLLREELRKVISENV